MWSLPCLLLLPFGGGTAAAALLGISGKTCIIISGKKCIIPRQVSSKGLLLPVAFHHCPSSSSRSTRNQLRSSSDDNPTTTDDSSLLRQTIEKLVTIIGPPDEDNLVKPPPDPTNQNTSQQQHHPSIVHIIGTGLTPNLLSLPLSTLHLLSQADAVLYDSLGLAYEEICKVVPKHCEVICVGKRGDSQKSWKQSEIDDLILQMTTSTSTTDTIKPKTILRLKGGDPFLFGRARTEIETLRSNQIPYSYTPAISSCIAGPHLGGIPLTDPSLNCQSFGVWTGTNAFGGSRGLGNTINNTSDNDDNNGEHWDVDTLVFLMIGRLDKLEALCNLLISRGEKWEDTTPCAVIQNAGGRREKDDSGSQKIQRVWRGTLGSLVPTIRKEDKTRTSVSPAVFIVGATCELNFLSY